MADAVRLGVVEKQDLIGLPDGVVASHMTHEHAAVGKDQVRAFRTLLGTFMSAVSATDDIPQRQPG
jgi:hypothetical protein